MSKAYIDTFTNIFIYSHICHVAITICRKPEGMSHWGDQDVDGRIILRWIFRKLEGVVGTGWSWLRIGAGDGHLWVR